MNDEQSYYFLEIPIDDPNKVMDLIGKAGLKEELETGPTWLHAYLGQSLKNLVAEEIFLVKDNTIWQWDEIVHQEYQSDPEAADRLLKSLGIPEDVHIPVFRLTDESMAPVIDVELYAIYPEGNNVRISDELRKLGVYRPGSLRDEWLDETNINDRAEELLYVRDNRILQPEEYEKIDLKKIPVYMLDDLTVLQHAKDIASVLDKRNSQNNFITLPFERRTMEVCVAAVRTNYDNIKHIGVLNEADILKKAYMGRISPLFDTLKNIRSWAIDIKSFYDFAGLDERCIALPDYKDLPKYGVGMEREMYDHIKAVSSDDAENQYFKKIPFSARNYLISTAAVQAYGMNLKEVPENLKTPVLIMKALENNGLALEFVRSDQLTGEMIDMALKNSNGEAIRFVPDELITKDIGLTAIGQALQNSDRDASLTGKILKAIPDAYIKVEAAEMVWQSNINRYLELYEQIFEAEKKGGLCPGMDKQQMEDLGFISTYPISFIPEERYTPLLCDMAILGNGGNIKYIPEGLRNDEIITSSLCKYGDALEFLPEEKKNYENCLAAVRGDNYALHFVPEKYLTEDLCRIAVDTGAKMFEEFETPDSISIFEKIPYPDIIKEGISLLEPHLNRDKLLEVIEKDPACLKYIPDNYKTKSFYNKAVKTNGWALEHVPEDMKTKKMCRNAKKASSDLEYAYLDIVSFVPFPDVALEYMKEAQGKIDVSDVFLSIRKDILNERLIREAIKMDPVCFRFLEDNQKSKELCVMAVQSCGATGDIFRYIPEKMKDDDICKLAIDINPNAIKWIPEDRRSAEICLRAVLDHTGNKAYVPEVVKNEKNIYSFFNRVDKYDFQPKLNYKQIIDLYNGASLIIPKIKHSGHELINMTINYNRDKNCIVCTAKQEKITPVLPKMENKNNSIKL